MLTSYLPYCKTGRLTLMCACVVRGDSRVDVAALSVGGRLPPAGGFLPHSENTRRERRSSVSWVIKKGQLLFI